MPRVLKLVIALFLFACPAKAVTYFIAPAGAGGSDSNNGLTSGAPWLTPNHAVNCGDVISAAAGTYAEANFRVNNWGVSTCAGANNVAWLKCAVAFTCGITVSTAGHDALGVSQSFWGVQGWVVTVTTVSTNQCFQAFPPNNSTEIHHIIFANNVANGCGDGAFTTGQATSTVGVDYIEIIGNIAYNGAQDNANCYSGIDFVPLKNSDTAPGTHSLISGNFAWGNIDPNPCGGVTPTDGHGISLDTLDGNGSGPYSGQVVIDNNISVFNGATGIQSFANAAGNPTVATTFIRNNTIYGNETGSINANPCGEVNVESAFQTATFGNLVQTTTNTCSGSVAEFALASSSDATSDFFYLNFVYSAAGNNTTGTSSRFAANLTGTNPGFANPVQPSAPNCSGFATVPACMATVIANFTPSNATAKKYGYQVPSATQRFDPLFPQWLCTVTNLPAGLLTMGCKAGGDSITNGKLSGGKIH